MLVLFIGYGILQLRKKPGEFEGSRCLGKQIGPGWKLWWSIILLQVGQSQSLRSLLVILGTYIKLARSTLYRVKNGTALSTLINIDRRIVCGLSIIATQLLIYSMFLLKNLLPHRKLESFRAYLEFKCTSCCNLYQMSWVASVISCKCVHALGTWW